MVATGTFRVASLRVVTVASRLQVPAAGTVVVLGPPADLDLEIPGTWCALGKRVDFKTFG